MATVNVNVSFQKELLEEIDEEAKRESRSRSDLLREAAKMYVRRQKQWDEAFALGDRQTGLLGLTQEDVVTELESVRQSRRAAK